MTGDVNSDFDRSHQHYIKLCALASSGTLSDAEWIRLKMHVAECKECGKRLQKYRDIARIGMALLMPETDEQPSVSGSEWTVESARQELFRRIHSGEEVIARKSVVMPPRQSLIAFLRVFLFPGPVNKLLPYAAAIAFVASVCVLSYSTGAKRGQVVAATESKTVTADRTLLRGQIDQLKSERATLDQTASEQKLALQRLRLELQQRSVEVERWKAVQSETERARRSLFSENIGLQDQLRSAFLERALIGRKLQESDAALKNTELQFENLRQQRAADLLRSASLQTRIDELSARLKDRDGALDNYEKYLASDRDVRELMGARQLYIADVFDVDAAGEKRKPYGRVFYTKNKSLIFYAFDLDQQPRVKNAATFQAWGRRGVGDNVPLNMGIFYLDSESNKRWVLKFDNPKALSEIDAVFVTVEFHGPSRKPSGKQLLFASLRTPPNHP